MTSNEKLFNLGDAVIVLRDDLMGSTGIITEMEMTEPKIYVKIDRTSYYAQQNIDFQLEMYPEMTINLDDVEFGPADIERLSGYSVNAKNTMLTSIGARFADYEKQGFDVNLDLYAFILDHTNSLEDFAIANNLSTQGIRSWILRGRYIPLESQIILAECGYPMDAQGMSSFAHYYVQQRINEGTPAIWKSEKRTFNSSPEDELYIFAKECAYSGWQIEVYGVYQDQYRPYPQVVYAIKYFRSSEPGDYFLTRMRLAKLKSKTLTKRFGEEIAVRHELRFRIPYLTIGEEHTLREVIADEYPEYLEQVAI